MWNRIDKLTKAIIVMAVIATIAVISAFALQERVKLLSYQNQSISDTNESIRNKMSKAREEGMKYR